MSTPELDLELAEILNWDTMSHAHGANAPPALRTMTVTRREALIARVRAVQSVDHAYVEARTQPGQDEGAPLSLRITETDRQVFNRLLRPSRPAHYQLGNQGGRSTVQRVEQENLTPPAHQQVVGFAHLILAAPGRAVRYRAVRGPKCDTEGAQTREALPGSLDKRKKTRAAARCRKRKEWRKGRRGGRAWPTAAAALGRAAMRSTAAKPKSPQPASHQEGEADKAGRDG